MVCSQVDQIGRSTDSLSVTRAEDDATPTFPSPIHPIPSASARDGHDDPDGFPRIGEEILPGLFVPMRP